MPGCEACFFNSPKIGNRGPEDSPFIIVGESPGIMEIHKGMPFIGPSGEVIEETLKRCGVEDLDCEPYFTNAISCLPRKRKDAKENQDLLIKACLSCRSRLIDDVTKYPRKVILALGNAAIWSLTGNFGLKITKERGKLFKSPMAEVGIVTAVHPAFLLRGNGNFTQFEADIRYAVNLMKEGDQARKLPNGVTWRILETKEEVEEFANELNQMSPDEIIAADIETTGFNYMRDRILCQGIMHKPKLATIIPEGLITPNLFTSSARYTWHNGKFDARFIKHQITQDVRVDEDTMLLSYALNERGGIHDLDQVASDRLGSPNHKSMLDPYTKGTIIDAITQKKRKRNYGDAPRELLYKYLALDLSDTYHLHAPMRAEVAADPHLEKLYTRTLIPASKYLVGIEMNGMTVDPKQVRTNEIRLTKELGELEEQFNQIAKDNNYGEVNVRSWQQLQAFLYGHLKLGPITLSTDKDTIESLLKEKEHPALRTLLKHRKAAKSYGTYVKSIPGNTYPDGKVHTTYKLHGTATGRLASSEPNMQNIPRDPLLRGQFIPRAGYAILEVDYSQAELRSLAQLSKCTALSAIFLQGLDLHVELTEFLFGKNWTKEDKMKAKTVNFGIPYGREAPSMAEAFDVSVKEAQSWIDGWAERFPGAWEFIQKCRAAPLHNQTMITCFGNKKRPGVVSMEKLKDLQNESANFPHQNIAASLTTHAGMKLIEPLKVQYDTHIINTVHDCLVTETPFNLDDPQGSKQRIIHIAKMMMDVMEEEPKLWGLNDIPFKAEPEFGWRWGNVLKFGEIEEMYNGRFEDVPDQIAAH